MPDDAASGVAPRKWLLALDTSSDQAGIALFDGNDLYMRQWPCVRAQTTQVLPAIRELLSAARISISDLACVSVATGPGTFTGLRVGMSLAKGFALGRSLPLVGVPTLQAAAYPWISAGLPVIAVVPAGRGRLVWQRFSVEDNGAMREAAPQNTTPQELIEAIELAAVRVVAGELPAHLREALRDLLVPIVSGPERPARVGAIAALGFDRYMRGDIDDPVTLEPLYVHGVRAAVRPVADPRP